MTKAELEAENARLVQTVNRQRDAINMLSKDMGMEIVLPWAPHMAKTGAACYISGSKQQFNTVIIPMIEEIIKEHGIPEKSIGNWIESASEVRLGEGCHSDPAVYLIPRTVGLMLVKLMDAAGVISQAAYKAGYIDGSNLLNRLQQSEITVDEFEGSIDQMKARETQTYKFFTSEEKASFNTRS